ncbi:MAG: Ppx/GppA phosphatase family protein [Nitriliruptoraceae bacterium]
MKQPCAAVDVGSNSIRLLVCDADGNRLERRMAITRLATGIDASGRFDETALEHTLDVIETFAACWTAHGVTSKVRIAATSAVRDAADREQFFTGVHARTGIHPEVLSGSDEAAFAYLGAVTAVGGRDSSAVVDIGGGSTEIVVGTGMQVSRSTSMQMGCVRMAERYARHDPLTAHDLDALRADVRNQLDDDGVVGADEFLAADQLIAVAGTATTIGALHLGLDQYDETQIHGCRVPAPALDALTDRLLAMTSRQRGQLGPMQPGREDVIHAGALILREIVACGGFDSVIVSEHDGLDGLAASLAD